MLHIVTSVVLVVLAVAILIAFGRLATGPTLPDRIVAMDLIAVLVVSLIVVASGATRERVFLDAAIVIVLLGFIGTIAYAGYVERGHD